MASEQDLSSEFSVTTSESRKNTNARKRHWIQRLEFRQSLKCKTNAIPNQELTESGSLSYRSNQIFVMSEQQTIRSNVLGSYSTSSSMSEESIRFMDDIDEEGAGSLDLHMESENDVFLLDSEPAMIRRKSKSPSASSSLGVLETSVEVHPVPREVASPQKIRTILVKSAASSEKSKKVQNGGMRIIPALKLEHGSSSSPRSASSLLLSLNEASKTKGLNEVLPWRQKSLEDPPAQVPTHKDSLTDKTLGPTYYHRATSPAASSVHSTVSSTKSRLSDAKSEMSSILGPDKEQLLSDRMRHIVTHFRKRAFAVKQRLEEPPSPDDDASSLSEDLEGDQIEDAGTPIGKDKSAATPNTFEIGQDDNKGLVEKLTERKTEPSGRSSLGVEMKQQPSVLPNIKPRPNLHAQHHNLDTLERLVFEDFNGSPYASKSTIVISGWEAFFCDPKLIKRKFEFIDPRGYINIAWLFVQAMIFLYNAWVIPLRAIFPFAQTSKNLIPWLVADYTGDFIYLVDMFVYKRRLMFMENGFWVKNKRRLTRQYVREGTFRYDVAALIPLEILYVVLGVDATYLRLPRIIKCIAFWEFTERLDSVLAKPYFLRIVKTVTYMLYLIHLNACAYFAISDWEGIGVNDFVYNGEGNAYIRCFYFATKTATSIGKNKKPTTGNIAEILFMTGSWLLGVFVFAILIGDIRDIVGTARRNALSFQRQLDAITTYMNNNKVAKHVQERVKRWMNYTWSQQKSFDEHAMLSFLPLKMRTDIAMRVHYSTLGKVKLFRNCEPGLLKDLVVLLRPVIYLPGDFICRKNDIGKEMFIIQSGQVQVLGGIDGRRVLVTLGQGSVFGEIALLGVGGMNRRTADVVSRGFSNLFVLQKDDLETVLKDYADAKRILNARARKLMKENEERLAKEVDEQKQLQANKKGKSKAISDEENIIFPVSSLSVASGSGSGGEKRDPALIETLRKMLPPRVKVKNYLMMSSPKLEKHRPISASNLKVDKLDSASSIFMPRSGSMDRSLNVSNFNNSSLMGQASQATRPSHIDEFVMETKRRISYFSDESSPYSNLSRNSFSPSVMASPRRHNDFDVRRRPPRLQRLQKVAKVVSSEEDQDYEAIDVAVEKPK